jgi:transmembrane sensor
MSDSPGASGAEPQVDWDALARYLAGEGSAAERATIQQWLASHTADAKVVHALDDALGRVTPSPNAREGIDVEAALVAVNAKRALLDASPSSGRQVLTLDSNGKRSGTSPATRWIPLAAAAVLVLAVGTVVWRGRVNRDDTQMIASRTFTTGIGGRDSLQLPDGTSIVLGPRSRITLAAGYGQEARNVELEGEAYFDVHHDATRPFVIAVNGATVRDIGTAFAVHADSLGLVRVAVKSGTVEIQRTGTSIRSSAVLNAGDVGLLDSAGEVIAERGAASDDDLAWTRGTLVFRDATISEVRDDLRRWYGIELVATDSVLRRHLTATFGAHDSVATILRTIALSLPASIERRGDTAFVRSAPETRQRK